MSPCTILLPIICGIQAQSVITVACDLVEAVHLALACAKTVQNIAHIPQQHLTCSTVRQMWLHDQRPIARLP